MARTQERLVEEIRARRRVLGHELRTWLALEPVRNSIRQAPLPWVAGSTLSGFVAGRLLVRPTWKRRRSMARSWVRGRLRDVFLQLVLVGMRENKRRAAAPEKAVSPGRQSSAAGRESSGGRPGSSAPSPEPSLEKSVS